MWFFHCISHLQTWRHLFKPNGAAALGVDSRDSSGLHAPGVFKLKSVNFWCQHKTKLHCLSLSKPAADGLSRSRRKKSVIANETGDTGRSGLVTEPLVWLLLISLCHRLGLRWPQLRVLSLGEFSSGVSTKHGQTAPDTGLTLSLWSRVKWISLWRIITQSYLAVNWK